MICEFVQGVLPERLAMPSHRADRVARGIRPLKRPFQRFGLLFRGQQFDLSYQLHAKQYSPERQV